MALSNHLAFLCFMALWPCMPSAFIERRVLCSSEKLNVWYTYDGPLYYLSISTSPCSFGVSVYNVSYTVISMFTLARIGYDFVVYYKGQVWLEYTQSDLLCEDTKICYIIKGETFHETFPMYVKKMYGPAGEYHIFLTVTIIDELQGPLSLRFNITVEVKNGSNNKNKFFPHLEALQDKR